MSGWRGRSDHGSLLGLTTAANPYRGFRYPTEGIQHAVWLYHCFSLSLRDIELILAARGVVVSYETVRAYAPGRTPGIAHENGAIESQHGHAKDAAAQRLTLRRSPNFASLNACRYSA